MGRKWCMLKKQRKTIKVEHRNLNKNKKGIKNKKKKMNNNFKFHRCIVGIRMKCMMYLNNKDQP